MGYQAARARCFESQASGLSPEAGAGLRGVFEGSCSHRRDVCPLRNSTIWFSFQKKGQRFSLPLPLFILFSSCPLLQAGRECLRPWAGRCPSAQRGITGIAHQVTGRYWLKFQEGENLSWVLTGARRRPEKSHPEGTWLEPVCRFPGPGPALCECHPSMRAETPSGQAWHWLLFLRPSSAGW